MHSFGPSRDEDKLQRLERKALEFIRRYGGQTVLEFEENRACTPTMPTTLFDSISAIVQKWSTLDS